MSLNRQYTKESLFRIMSKLKKSEADAFLDSIAPVLVNLRDYEFFVSFLLKFLSIASDSYRSSDNDKRVEKLSKLFIPVFINIITDVNRVKDFLSKLDNGKDDNENTLKEARFTFASKLHHAIHNSDDLEAILPMLKESDHTRFIIAQNNYWFVHQKNCRIAFLSGRHPASAETYKLFGPIDRNVFVKIMHDADLLPRPTQAPK